MIFKVTNSTVKPDDSEYKIQNVTKKSTDSYNITLSKALL